MYSVALYFYDVVSIKFGNSLDGKYFEWVYQTCSESCLLEGSVLCELLKKR